MGYFITINVIYVILMNNTNLFKFAKSQYKRTSKNFYSFFSIFSVQTLVQIVFPPAMIFTWGIEKFGIWIFLISVPSILGIFNINFSLASRSEMSIYFEKKNFVYLNKIFQNTICLIITSSLLFFLIWITLFLLNKINFKILEIIEYENLKIIFLFLFLSTHCLIIDQIFYCGISYKGDTSKYNYNNLIIESLIKTLIPISGLFTENLIYASLIFLVLSACKTFLLFILFKKQNRKNLNLKTNLFNLRLCIKIFKLSLSYQLDNVSFIIRNHGLIILIGAFFSPVFVGLISTSRTLFYFLPGRFMNIIDNTLYFEYSKLYGSKDFSFLKMIFKYHIYILIFFMTTFTILSLIFGKFIFDFWTNYKYDLSHNLMFLIIIDTIIFNSFNSLETLIKSINKFFYSALLKSSLSILLIILSFALFTTGYSFLSYFFISIISSLITLIFILFMTHKFFNKYYK